MSNLNFNGKKKNYKIYPRTPQPRKRKVSVYDLVTALEKIIEKNKIKVRFNKNTHEKVEVKLNSKDMNMVIKDVFNNVNLQCENKKTNQLKFTDLIPSTRKEDLISTFVPLLHLTNQRITDLHQEEAFADFDVHLLKKGMKFEDIEKNMKIED